MANVLRPLRAPERRTRLNLSPVTPDDLRRHSTTTTRPTLRSGPLLTLTRDEKPVKQSTNLPARPTPPTRTNSRKRPASALSPDATDRKPLTKIAVTQLHGDLLRVPNGVAASSANDLDHVSSTRSTPQPGAAGKLASQDKRSLRSHDGSSRLKSDLPIYFSNYDDVIAGLPKPAELVHLDTPIYIVDEPAKTKTPTTPIPRLLQNPSSPTRSRKRRASSISQRTSVTAISPSQSSTNFQVLDYKSVAKHIHYDDGQDPLADSEYFMQHRRAERKEKQLRNIEKERAMHEKVQLERLLDGLQGPDWLKVMGITGVTDGERKDWEPKRDYFVKEVEALVDKFRLWKEEEKRLRAAKEAALVAREEEDEQDDDGDDDDDDDNGDEAETESSEIIVTNGRQPKHHHPTSTSTSPPKPRRPPRPHGFLIPLNPLPLPTEPFQSFYAKPHLRAAALGKHRHGRNASAFGMPIPDFHDQEFEIPEEYLDPLFLRDNARQRRRRKREQEGEKGKEKDSG